MYCYIIQPNNVILEFDIDPKANGQDCLDKVCERLGIIEVDYFGLQYAERSGEHLWLNLRNSISKQLPGRGPFYLKLRVKFHVQPHFVQQQITRHQVFLQTKQDIQDERFEIKDAELFSSIAALICQAELGDYATPISGVPLAAEELYLKYKSYFPKCSREVIEQVMRKHSQLNGLQRTNAEYRMLQEVAKLEIFGMEFHEVKEKSNCPLHMGVGPEGIALYDKQMVVQRRIEYPTIQMATHDGNFVLLHLLKDDSSTAPVAFKLCSKKAANALYRCVIEMHSFYRCDTVRNAVARQFCRDLKGTLASFFNENTDLGKKYVFDIQRTCREAYDRARRILYRTENTIQRPHEGDCLPHTPSTSQENICFSDHCQEMRNEMERMQDTFLCRVCMAAEFNTLFHPCAHLVCCADCAARVDTCPVCRADIDSSETVFLPTAGQLETMT